MTETAYQAQRKVLRSLTEKQGSGNEEVKVSAKSRARRKAEAAAMKPDERPAKKVSKKKFSG